MPVDSDFVVRRQEDLPVIHRVDDPVVERICKLDCRAIASDLERKT